MPCSKAKVRTSKNGLILILFQYFKRDVFKGDVCFKMGTAVVDCFQLYKQNSWSYGSFAILQEKESKITQHFGKTEYCHER